MNKVFGFIGIESYDIMYYLASTLTKLHMSVLMVDNSDDKSLAYSVPNFDDFAKLGIISYVGVDIAVDLSAEQLQESSYDYVLVYFGFSRRNAEIALCSEVYLVTDLQLHNIFRLSRVELSEDAYVFLVVRDRYCSKMSPELVLDSLKQYVIDKDNIIYLDDSAEDLNAKILCQYNSKITFKKVSKSIIGFVTKVLCVDFSEKDIVEAFKIAARGVKS